MEKNTKTEQYLELDDEQLQDVTGGGAFADNQTAIHQKHIEKLSILADAAKNKGDHNSENKLTKQIADHMEAITILNTMRR